MKEYSQVEAYDYLFQVIYQTKAKNGHELAT